MQQIKLHTHTKQVTLDTLTPVGIYLKLRDVYRDVVMLESTSFDSEENASTFIAMNPIAQFRVHDHTIYTSTPVGETSTAIESKQDISQAFQSFMAQFQLDTEQSVYPLQALFGYMGYDTVAHVEKVDLNHPIDPQRDIDDMRYCLYRYVLHINHFNNEYTLIENNLEGQASEIDLLHNEIKKLRQVDFPFETVGEESSNLTDSEFEAIVQQAKEHCQRGDVFQMVLSRRFSQQFKGDDFNVYRALRSVNPSPYLFYFNYGSYSIFGSSPEAQIVIQGDKATINPIAGTYRRTGDQKQDDLLGKKLSDDPKENAEHVMLVDLARNDLSRHAREVSIDFYKEVHQYSHVIHLVSQVSGKLKPDVNLIDLVFAALPAGTLSGAPKVKAMNLIGQYEPDRRTFYGGCIGPIFFNGNVNQAILIRSFLSIQNQLHYQAGAGVVIASDNTSEMQEAKNKLLALKTAIEKAQHMYSPSLI